MKQVKHASNKTKEEINNIVKSKSNPGTYKHPTVTANPVFGKQKEINTYREKKSKKMVILVKSRIKF